GRTTETSSFATAGGVSFCSGSTAVVISSPERSPPLVDVDRPPDALGGPEIVAPEEPPERERPLAILDDLDRLVARAPQMPVPGLEAGVRVAEAGAVVLDVSARPEDAPLRDDLLEDEVARPPLGEEALDDGQVLLEGLDVLVAQVDREGVGARIERPRLEGAPLRVSDDADPPLERLEDGERLRLGREPVSEDVRPGVRRVHDQEERERRRAQTLLLVAVEGEQEELGEDQVGGEIVAALEDP